MTDDEVYERAFKKAAERRAKRDSPDEMRAYLVRLGPSHKDLLDIAARAMVEADLLRDENAALRRRNERLEAVNKRRKRRLMPEPAQAINDDLRAALEASKQPQKKAAATTNAAARKKIEAIYLWLDKLREDCGTDDIGTNEYLFEELRKDESTKLSRGRTVNHIQGWRSARGIGKA